MRKHMTPSPALVATFVPALVATFVPALVPALVAIMAAGVLAAGPAQAGGIYVPGYGAQALARGGAFAARADDPSALHHNPAGFAKLSGTVALVSANLLDLSLTYQRAGVYENPPGSEEVDYAGQPYPQVSDQSRPAFGLGSFQAVPLVAVGTDLGLDLGGLRLGVGVLTPHGYPERSFAPDYQFADEGQPPPQRYDIVEQSALVVLPSLVAAYRIADQLDLGVRLSWGIAQLQASSYVWGLSNYEEWIARDGKFDVEVRDNFVPAVGLGVLYRPASWLEIGAAYASALAIDAQGTGTVQLGSALGFAGQREQILPVDDARARCAPGGTAEAIKTCLQLQLPQSATLGARWILREQTGGERADIELDVKWENWSAASDYRFVIDGESQLIPREIQDTVIRHGLRDVLSVRLGGSFTQPIGPGHLIVRGGVAYDTATAPNSWQRVDLDGAARTTLAAGLGYEIGRIRVEFAGGAVLEGTRTVAECNPDATMPGCPPGSGEMAVSERSGPDPAQPLFDADDQRQNPFNAGSYESGYVLLGLGVTVGF